MASLLLWQCEDGWRVLVMDWNIVWTRNEGAKGGKGKEQENGQRRGVLGYLGRCGSAALGTMATEIYEHLSIDLQTHWCNRVSQVINEHADKACAGSNFLLQHISVCISSHTYVIYMGWSSHIMHVSWINKGKQQTISSNMFVGWGSCHQLVSLS